MLEVCLVGISVGVFCIYSVEFPLEVNFHTVDFFFFLTKLAVCLGRYLNKEQRS